uniref:Glutaredoxin n=1 Tax=Rhabditophanes sp. KR3021 TaxID=114890 RepID=A0AC35TRE9_9BILA
MLRTAKLFTLPQTFLRFNGTKATSAAAGLSPELKSRIQEIINHDKVVVFMKGTPDEPACGFSRNVKLVLEHHQVPFVGVNVLEDAEIREGIKKYSEWPTIPQVYVNKEFVGGCDILIEMHKGGEITEFFEVRNIKTKYSDSK